MSSNFHRAVRAISLLGTYSENDVTAACQQLESQYKPVTTDNILDVLQKDAINRLSANGHGGLSTQHLHSGNDVSFLRSDDEIVTGTTEGSSNSTSELVRAEDNRMKSVTLCLGCHEREANVIFHPCEHKVLCRECWAPPYETNCPACDLAVNSFGDADWN